MFSRVSIKNYKSIRNLEFETKRVNVFVGEPNTGKTNVLDALALLSAGVHNPQVFKEFFRFRSFADLFWNQEVKNSVEVETSQWKCVIEFHAPRFKLIFPKPELAGKIYEVDEAGRASTWVDLTYGVRAYRFKALTTFGNATPGILTPPFGDNLFTVIYTNQSLRQMVGGIFRPQGFRLLLKPSDYELAIAKDVNEELYTFHWNSVSETFRRIAFLMAVLETNRESVLVLDEPEAHTFPFYTKYLAERIALDESNQFFMTTHNPYLLSSIVEKTQSKDLAVFVTTLEQFETKLRRIPQQRLPKLLDLGADAFFNLNRLVDE